MSDNSTHCGGSTCLCQSKLQGVLQKYFGFSNFRPGQAEAALAILHGQDVFIRMATGSGKSLCMFLGPLSKSNVAIGVIISPLNGLMHQQVRILMHCIRTQLTILFKTRSNFSVRLVLLPFTLELVAQSMMLFQWEAIALVGLCSFGYITACMNFCACNMYSFYVTRDCCATSLEKYFSNTFLCKKFSTGSSGRGSLHS